MKKEKGISYREMIKNHTIEEFENEKDEEETDDNRDHPGME